MARLPVFASDIPPVAESSGGNSYLFDPQGDPQAIAGMIANTLNSDRAYLLKQRVLERYSWKAILNKKILPLINEVINNDR